MKSYMKNKAGAKLGFRTPDFFKNSRFGGKLGGSKSKFNPSQFKTQHKGG